MGVVVDVSITLLRGRGFFDSPERLLSTLYSKPSRYRKIQYYIEVSKLNKGSKEDNNKEDNKEAKLPEILTEFKISKDA